MRIQLSAYEQAIKYLAIRSHTVFELQTKLARKKYHKSEIDQAIADLIEKKYVNDRDFAQAFAQNLIKYKTFGYYGVKMKLKQRGISDELAEEVLSQEMDFETERKIAQRAVGKSGKTDKLKLMQMLQRKGFRLSALDL